MRYRVGVLDEVEVSDCYAAIAPAVGMHELDMLAPLWDMARAAGWSPQQMVEHLTNTADITIKYMPGGTLPVTKARQFMDHPDFLRYVAGKLGAM